MFDINLCRKAILDGSYEWRKHTLQRMAERNILQSDIIEVVLQGEVIKNYDDDKPFPSGLLFRIVNRRPLHVVVALDNSDVMAFIVTVYEPSAEFFEPDFKTKKKGR
jgi:Domain of unknown function (DUF4258)